MKYLTYGAVTGVAIAVIGAFFVIGSPAHERQVRFDERRLGDLWGLQSQIAYYQSSKGRLPAALSDLNGFQGFVVPNDPETGNEYEYSIQGSRSFRLCATFALPSEESDRNSGYYSRYPVPEGGEQSWQHEAGRSCFDLTVENAPAAGSVPPISVKPVPGA